MSRRAATLGLAALLAGGCASIDPAAAPARLYHSAKAREAIADCLLNRLGGSEYRIDRRDVGAATVVTASQGLARTVYFAFTLTDAPGGGTAAELRRASAIAPGLHNAETCFDPSPRI